MRLGGRLAAAIEVLADMDARHRPAAEALRDWGLSHRFAGAGDRAAIGNIVYDVMRRRRSAAFLMDDDTPRAAALGALVLEWNLPLDEVAASFEGDRFAPEPVSQGELAAAQSRSIEDAPDAVRADCPDWCVPLLRGMFGEDWVGEAAALAGRPPLDMRANLLKADRDRVAKALAAKSASPSPIAPAGLRIAPIEGGGRHPNVQAEPAFQKGWFEVQDEGSQMAAKLAGAAPGMQVLDYCAGAGGKTLAFAADMGNRGQVFAHDADKSRLAPIFDRLRRAGARNVQVVAEAADLEPLRGQMDLVVVDAPCTGSGTWRRRPDAKWRLTERQLEARLAEQAMILEDAARFVKPGGRLAYVTCSVFEAENGAQVERFRDAGGGFEPVDHADAFARAFGDRAGAARIEPARGIALSPHRTGTDGFFIGILKRAA